MISSPYEYIRFQAHLSPTAVAVDLGTHQVPYERFCADIEKVTRFLVAEGVQPGQRVAVCWADSYMHWLATIALMRIGAVSVSAHEVAHLNFIGAPTVISDVEAAGEGRRLIRATRDWLAAAADSLPAFADALHPPDRMIRIVLSSGTTGVPKKVGLTAQQLYERGRGAVRMHGLNATSRVMSLVGIDTIAGLMMPLYAWTGGARVLIPPPAGGRFGAQLVQARPNLVFTSPARLAAILDTLPRGHWPQEEMEIYVSGSILPTPLARRARLALTQRLYILYGSTEAGTISLAHASAAEGRPGFAGYVLPPGPVQAVDEEGRVLAAGESGELRMRQEGMSAGYVDDDGADGAFRGGWFYPGDLGSIDKDGGLIVHGRRSELMNLGGMKVSPATIEEALSGFDGTKDLAAFSAPREDGIESLWLAVVAPSGLDNRALQAEYRRALPAYPRMTIILMNDIPRNAMGKVLRDELRERLKKAVVKKPEARTPA